MQEGSHKKVVTSGHQQSGIFPTSSIIPPAFAWCDTASVDMTFAKIRSLFVSSLLMIQ